MIEFYSENNFDLSEQDEVSDWIKLVINSEGYTLGEVSYIFCSDEYLLQLNEDFLNHDTLTDIISFDYSLGKEINGEIYISIDRVTENSSLYKVPFLEELHRVIIHGILHYCGYKDKTDEEATLMRQKENEALSKRNFL
ncbi:rRNA maturation RNase YbeY [Jejudonia soesokkakensis]|uniref:Endoribonuclease YbeY n=1 Tax=Jejudonia soesokkakensis TaxID=1323432 RepID=A0ABW2MRN2_9FLAO